MTLRATFILGITLCLTNPLAWSDTDALTQAERQLFPQTYETEPPEQRLSRLETLVFGQAQNGSAPEREARLLRIIQNQLRQRAQSQDANTPTANDPTENTPADPAPGNKSKFFTWDDRSTGDHSKDATDYPTVTAIERQVFARDFIRDDITRRLDRLEQRVFQTTYPQRDLVDRVDRLLTQFPGLETEHSALGKNYEIHSPQSSALAGLPDSSSQFTGSSHAVYPQLRQIEQIVFPGQSFEGELLTERLDRLENRVYGKTSAGQSIDSRVSRLASTVRPAPGTTADRPPQSAPYGGTGQNVQIGVGVSSQSVSQYSPELINMLPPNFRAQLYGQQNQQSGTVISAPGTVILPGRQSSGSGGAPAFQTYSGQPLQHQSSVQGAPGVYTGDPANLRRLEQLEINVFGAPKSQEPFDARLMSLETTLMGKTYPGYPDADRLGNLDRAYTYFSLRKTLGGT